MIATAAAYNILDNPGLRLLYEHSDKKVLIFERAGLLFAFNFHPNHSYSDFRFEAPPGKYQMIVDSDAAQFGGHGRLVADQQHFSMADGCSNEIFYQLSLYLPCRSAQVLRRCN